MNDQRSGDERAPGFDDFMAVEQAGLLRFAAALTGDARLAEDLVANVLGRVYEQWRRIGGLERPGAYVRRMVVNEFLSYKRRERRHVLLLDEHTSAAPDHAGQHAERDELRARLGALPRKQRAAIVLRYYEGLPDDEIAAVLGCARATVRSLIHRALTTLRIEPSAAGTSGPPRRYDNDDRRVNR